MLRIDEGERRSNVVAGGAQEQTIAQLVVHADAGASGKGDVGRLVETANVFATEEATGEDAGLPEESGFKDGSEENHIDRRGLGETNHDRTGDWVHVSGPVGGEAKVFSPIAGDGELRADLAVARSVDHVEAGVADAQVGVVLIGIYPLGVGGFMVRG